jgi:hypothetical protein
LKAYGWKTGISQPRPFRAAVAGFLTSGTAAVCPRNLAPKGDIEIFLDVHSVKLLTCPLLP